MSVRTAGLPKPTHSAPPVHELLPLSETLSRVGIALCCIWATYTHRDCPRGKAVPAEPPQAAELASTPCMLVFASNIPHLVRVHRRTSRGGGISCRTPEVSVVSSCELSSCPVTAKKAVLLNSTLVLSCHGLEGRL